MMFIYILYIINATSDTNQPIMMLTPPSNHGVHTEMDLNGPFTLVTLPLSLSVNLSISLWLPCMHVLPLVFIDPTPCPHPLQCAFKDPHHTSQWFISRFLTKPQTGSHVSFDGPLDKYWLRNLTHMLSTKESAVGIYQGDTKGRGHAGLLLAIKPFSHNLRPLDVPSRQGIGKAWAFRPHHSTAGKVPASQYWMCDAELAKCQQAVKASGKQELAKCQQAVKASGKQALALQMLLCHV